MRTLFMVLFLGGFSAQAKVPAPEARPAEAEAADVEGAIKNTLSCFKAIKSDTGLFREVYEQQGFTLTD